MDAHNKFRAFFRARARSRSRSRQPDAMHDPAPTRPRHLAPRDPPSASDPPPSSYLKSSVRSQNRPVSSTTTATHSTITPLPSDVLRNRSHAARHPCPFQSYSTDTHTSIRDHDQSSIACDDDSDDLHFPRSETPSRRRLGWHSFFGISLSRTSSASAPSTDRKGSTSTSASDPRANSSRKRSFRFTSRPTTPKSLDSASSKNPHSIPVPSSPLPLSASPRRRSFGLGSSQRSTPKSSSGHLPLPPPQCPQPPRPHGRRHSLGSERPPHDSAVALPEDPSHRTPPKPVPDSGPRNKGKERENLSPRIPLRDPTPSFGFPSQSLPAERSPVARNHPIFSHLPTVDSASSGENGQSSRFLQAIPKIVHTPPTPQRPGGEVDPTSRPWDTPPRVDAGKIEIAKGKTVAIAHREQVLVSTSHSYADPQRTASSKGRFTPRFLKDAPKTKDRGGQISNRRPPDAPAHKMPASNIIGPARNMTSHRGKLGSFDFERPVSALNRSSSTLDRQKTHAPADNSSCASTRLHSLERTMSEDSARGAASRIVAQPGQLESPPLKPDHTGEASVMSFSSLSLQTKSTCKDGGSTTPAGQSSSWGRVSGRRILRTSHGTFTFEHSSSVPSSPNPNAFNLPSDPNHMAGLPESQPSTPLHAILDVRGKHSRGQSYTTPGHVDSDLPNPGERKFKGKGRSLDLGLGLSWAPSRLREEVLMPGLILARERAKLEKNRTNGSDVTKMFESLLSESRFQTFKKYVRRFDAHIIPLEGPSGLLARVEKLLAESGLSASEREKLMSEFTVFAQSHGG